MDTSIELGLQTRLAPISSVNAEARTAMVTWTSGARVRRYDWIRGRHFFEELSLDPGSVRMARLQSGAPVLNSHKSGDLASVIGVVENAQLQGGQGTAKIRFSDRADVQPIFHDVLDGILKNVSQGYAIHEMEELPPDEQSEGLPIYRALSWEPFELSIVPIGADAGAQIRSDDLRKFPCTFRSRTMTVTNPKPAAEQPANTRSEAEIELERGLMIRMHVSHAQLDPKMADTLIKDRVPLDKAREHILTALAHRTSEVNIQSAAALHVCGREGTLPGMIDALSVRAGILPKPTPAAPYMHLRLSDMAAICLENAGQRMHGQSPDRIIRAAMLHTTSDFPNLLLGTGERALRMGYESFSGGLIRICKPSTARDFRSKFKLQLSEPRSCWKSRSTARSHMAACPRAKRAISLRHMRGSSG